MSPKLSIQKKVCSLVDRVIEGYLAFNKLQRFGNAFRSTKPKLLNLIRICILSIVIDHLRFFLYSLHSVVLSRTIYIYIYTDDGLITKTKTFTLYIAQVKKGVCNIQFLFLCLIKFTLVLRNNYRVFTHYSLF